MYASDVTAEMFSRKIISEVEKCEINNKPTWQGKNVALLEALERAIHLDCRNFTTFLNILESVRKYKHLVDDIRDEMKKW